MLYLWKTRPFELGLSQTKGNKRIQNKKYGELMALRERGDRLRSSNGPPRITVLFGNLWEKVYVFLTGESSRGKVPKVAITCNEGSEFNKAENASLRVGGGKESRAALSELPVRELPKLNKMNKGNSEVKSIKLGRVEGST